MPDVPIDAAEITSIRLVADLEELPLPPAGHIQLGYKPGSGLVARFPNGDYAGLSGIAPAGPPGPTGATGPSGPAGPQGPAGPAGEGGGGAFITGAGGIVNTAQSDPGGILLDTFVEGDVIKLQGPVVDRDGQPQAPDAVTLLVRTTSPDEPPTNRVVLWFDDDYNLRLRDDFDGTSLNLGGGGAAKVRATPSSARLEGGGAAQVYADPVSANLISDAHNLSLGATLAVWQTSGNPLLLTGLPTADPHLADQLWIAPLTRQLMVSAG